MSEPLWCAAYIGVGSNLNDPATRVTTAIESLAAIEQTVGVTRSRLYRSPPMGPQDQPDYVNAVAAVLSCLPPETLLLRLQQIEDAHGRDRSTPRWGPRTLDLDLLLMADTRRDDERLTLPHPGIADRAFVLFPLMEIAPALWVPGAGRVSELARALDPAAAVVL